MELDDWQKEVLNCAGNMCVRAGRQTGKSTIISIKASEYAVKNPRKQILIVSATERQAYLLFSKVLMYLDDNHRSEMKKGKDRPTKSEIKLRNGSIIRCLPTGMDGLGIRGYTTNMLIADEAHFIPEGVWQSITPQLTTTEAIQILISTTHGREGYFYRCFIDDKFAKFHVTTEEVANKRPEPMRTRMLEHVANERASMTNLQFMQEYCAEFVDDLRQFFPDSLVKETMTLKRRELISSARTYFLGVDIARMGEDESVFSIVDRADNMILFHVENQITTKTLLTDTIKTIIQLNKQYNFRKIYIDDGGLGVGVFDHLLELDETKRKVVAINNSARSLDNEEKKRKRLLKEDLYTNLLRLMERKEVYLLDDPEIFQSFKSVQYELVDGKMKIHGNYTHIVEALIRACWCVKDKSLNIWVHAL